MAFQNELMANHSSKAMNFEGNQLFRTFQRIVYIGNGVFGGFMVIISIELMKYGRNQLIQKNA
jgi:hypothetical protein